MKKILLVCISAFCYVLNTNAQCAQCTPIDCSVIKPTGGLCNQLPDDTAGQVYDEVISFYMPKRLSDPVTLAQCGGCSSVNLRRIDIVGMQGLPPGVSYTASQNGGYNVQGGDSIGCVRFCGTPIAPGTYYIIVNLLADVTANGTLAGDINVDDQPQTYRDTIVIYPGSSECPASFTIGNGPCVIKACDSISVNLNATLTNTFCPTLISYDWSYGNGSGSNLKAPGIVNYSVPDTFPLTLVTTYYTYRIKSVTVQCLGGWSGDIEEATSLQDPEPYITVNALGFSNKSTATSGRNKTFSNLNLEIPYNNCATPVNIEVWDLDESITPTASPSDLLGTHSITPNIPNQVTSSLSNSNISVTFDTVAASSITEVINVIVFPQPPVPQIVLSSDSICSGDSTLATITPTVTGYQYTWVQNDTIELQDADSSVYISQPGEYYARITNMETGCTETSAKVALAVGQSPAATVNIIFNGTSAFVTPFPASGFSVDWFYNGNLVIGQNGKFLPYLGDGLYEAQVYNTSFPDCRTIASSKDVVGIEDDVKLVYDLNVFPNPNTGKFNITFTSEAEKDIQITVQNTLSQVVFGKKFEKFTGAYSEEIDLSELSKGIYIVTIQTPRGSGNKKVVIQ